MSTSQLTKGTTRCTVPLCFLPPACCFWESRGNPLSTQGRRWDGGKKNKKCETVNKNWTSACTTSSDGPTMAYSLSVKLRPRACALEQLSYVNIRSYLAKIKLPQQHLQAVSNYVFYAFLMCLNVSLLWFCPRSWFCSAQLVVST